MMNRRWLLKLFGLGIVAAPVAAEAALPTSTVEVEAIDIQQITYRTTGEWGQGAGRMLSASEVDRNFYMLDQRLRNVGL